MTPEERFERFERQMEFLAGQTAENNAQIAQNTAQIAQNSAQIAQNSAQITQLTDLVLRLGRVVEQQGRQTDERFGRVEAALSSLAESQRRTDERLNALIIVVERYFSNGRH